MLTDDDLTRQLTAAFHDQTDALEYGGKVPRLRRRVPLSTLPVVAAAAAAVFIPRVAGDDSAAYRAPTSSASASALPSLSTPFSTPSASTTPIGTLNQVHLAGFTFETIKQITSDDPLLLRVGNISVPDDATPVTGAAGGHPAWVGTDPTNGQPAVWLKDGVGGHSALYEIYSSNNDWTADELVALIRHPVVPDRSGS